MNHFDQFTPARFGDNLDHPVHACSFEAKPAARKLDMISSFGGRLDASLLEACLASEWPDAMPPASLLIRGDNEPA